MNQNGNITAVGGRSEGQMPIVPHRATLSIPITVSCAGADQKGQIFTYVKKL